MDTMQQHLLTMATQTYASYYNGKMSYALYGAEWNKYVTTAFPSLGESQTSENVFKAVIDLYAEALMPLPTELAGCSTLIRNLLCRGESLVVVDPAGVASYPEHYEMISDGDYTVAAVFTRSLSTMEDYCTFIYSTGVTELWAKAVPADLAPAERTGYVFRERSAGYTLLRVALDDRGLGPSLAAQQDRVNHSIIDQTVIAEMYARPFWYLLNTDVAPVNPYVPSATAEKPLREYDRGSAGGRVFVTSGQGPFGQLTPPTIGDMISYHDSIIDKISQNFGVPPFYLKPGSSTPPTGVALKVLSSRFNNRVKSMRNDISPQLNILADLLGLTPEPGNTEVKLWSDSNDLLQDALDTHGIALSQMGYPLGYIAEVVTPGVDLDAYVEDTYDDPDVNTAAPGVDMTAMGQRGLPATPGQVAAYAANPGQRAVRGGVANV